ncbi:Rieske 2Fe-2S domain-containing protein [Mesorhizobium sp. VK23B]|uniref:Rieske 2Fe-2S domain-containing protein n=1 Tax=Mesorhizobium dulcispinae TaxID=3072316 RepID=A0ABU4XEH2_9HYPH|nr:MULTISPECIES: Rieske 2Fe-2S domain-containing protein [unclassified Mesorhizobium]MDX8466365.1 Rieske 2Fe-2S domain-containing protein [Mesorhizobium sp. VK23B]MDX8472175.1 Rieske 2Fe-2S domain-containing protein [Mesorhizobium sp. VK23A]
MSERRDRAKDHWQAVALSADIAKRPKRILLDGSPLVLFRSAQGIAALFDRCPHRLVELSTGKVVGGEIECPYHGWRYDGEGRCTAIPGHVGAMPHYRVRRYAAIERDGIVFVSSGTPQGEPYLHCMQGKDIIVRRVRSSTQSTVIDVAENILDATHTHFTHKGLLRGLTSKRHLVRVEVTGGEGWVEARYTGEDRQQGLISRLLEGERTKTIGRFRHPGIAELEYWGKDGLVLATTFHLRQADDRTVEGVGWLIGRRQGLLGELKALAFKPLFTIALHQDRRVLKSASDNARFAPQALPVIGPLDFLRCDIAAIMEGKMPPAADEPRVHQIEL